MIELTEEMKAAVRRRMGVPDGQEMDPWMAAAVEDVLAIVERDYRVSGRIQLHCGAPGPDGIVCQRGPRHGDLHAYAGDTGLVRW